MTNQKEFYQALTDYLGREEPLFETVAVLSYEVGKMLEQAMYIHWGDTPEARKWWLVSELMDAIAMCVLLCESTGVDFEETKAMGIEKAMERFTGKEKKGRRDEGS